MPSPSSADASNEDDHTYQGRLFRPSPFRDEFLSVNAEEVRLRIAPGMRRTAAADDDDTNSDNL